MIFVLWFGRVVWIPLLFRSGSVNCIVRRSVYVCVCVGV